MSGTSTAGTTTVHMCVGVTVLPPSSVVEQRHAVQTCMCFCVHVPRVIKLIAVASSLCCCLCSHEWRLFCQFGIP
jgi:hypothetical protein